MTIIADLLVPFCDAASLNIKDASKTVKKRFLVSISFINNMALHNTLFNDQYLDWNGVQEYLSGISYTVSDWIPLIKVLDFVQEIHPTPEVNELISNTFAGIRVPASQTKTLTPLESLRLCFAKIKVKNPAWDLLCKTFLACNLLDIDQVQILQAIFSAHFNEMEQNSNLIEGESPTNINNNNMMMESNIRELVRFMASFRHSKQEYTDSFACILDDSRCQVRSHVVIQSLKKRDALRETRQNSAILSGVAFRKPSLTQMLEIKSLREGAEHPQDSFVSFCRCSKIASNVNLRIKHTAYFLLCLPDNNNNNNSLIGGCENQSMNALKSFELSRIVGGDKIILANIQSMKIISPDIQELRKIIMDTHYTMTPSETLRKFKDQCVANCMVIGGRINWTTVMRLYMAAYCRQGISKDLWCYVLSNSNLAQQNQRAPTSTTLFHHSSSETEGTVQAFVKTNPMALHEVIDVMLMDV